MKNFKQRLQEALEQVSSQLGSNPGGVYTENGKKYYVKFPKNPDQARWEVLASKLHKSMGLKTTNPEIHNEEGKVGVKSSWVDGLTPAKFSDAENMNADQAHDVAKAYLHGVLTKNWDVVGTGVDYGQGNIHKVGHDIHVVDPGGTGPYRAQGGHKDYSPDISEFDSLRNPNVNRESAKFFDSVFSKHPDAIKKAGETVRNMNLDDVHHLFKNSGINNWESHHDTFLKRRKLLLDKLGISDK